MTIWYEIGVSAIALTVAFNLGDYARGRIEKRKRLINLAEDHSDLLRSTFERGKAQGFSFGYASGMADQMSSDAAPRPEPGKGLPLQGFSMGDAARNQPVLQPDTTVSPSQ